MIMKYRRLYNNKPKPVDVPPKITFEYVDREGNPIDMKAVQRR